MSSRSQRPVTFFRMLIAGLAAFAVSACETEPGLSSGNGLAPVGVPDGAEFPDGLEVGHRLMAAGEYEIALKAYTRALAEQGLTVDVLSALGSANMKLGRLKQARQLLERAVEEDESFVPAWNNLGVVYTGLGNHPQARQAFEAAFALDNGQSEEVWQNLLLAIENVKNNEAVPVEPTEFDLVRRGNGRFLLLETPS